MPRLALQRRRLRPSRLSSTWSVKVRLAQSFNRPGGNVTGSTILAQDMEQKRFGILNKVVPDVVRFGAMVNSNYPASAYQIRELEKAASDLGRQLFIAKASNDTELNAAFAALLREQIGALVIASDPYF